MSESEFIDLLTRFEKGQCTTDEQKLLESWLDSPGKGQVPFINEAKRIKVKNALRESVFKHKGSSSQFRFIPALGDHLKNESRDTTSSRSRWAYRIAAVILLIAIAGYGVFSYFERIESERYAATKISSGADIRKVLLSDGSIVWLKPNSSLQFPKNFRDEGERMISLQGEALFEVEKNPAQPFVVQAGELIATVLGTSFNIKTTEERTEVVVLTGKVSLTTTIDKQGVVILPDEKAIYNGSNKQLAKDERPVEMPVAKAIVTGTEYDMNFNGTRMSEVIRRVEGKFNVEVSMRNASLGNCIITADFTDQSLAKTMDIIAKALTAEYDIEGTKVMLSGEGCN